MISWCIFLIPSTWHCTQHRASWENNNSNKSHLLRAACAHQVLFNSSHLMCNRINKSARHAPLSPLYRWGNWGSEIGSDLPTEQGCRDSISVPGLGWRLWHFHCPGEWEKRNPSTGRDGSFHGSGNQAQTACLGTLNWETATLGKAGSQEARCAWPTLPFLQDGWKAITPCCPGYPALSQLAWLTPHSRGSWVGPWGGKTLFSTLLVLL